MGEPQLFQSSFRRAVADTIHAPRRNPWFFWSIGIVMVALGGFLGTVYTPEGSGRFISAICPTAGVILGAIIGIIIILIINLILAPYRQRNEARALLLAKPKPAPLQNRQKLFTAIHHLDEAARDMIGKHRRLKNHRELGKLESVILQEDSYEQKRSAFNDAFIKYHEVKKELELQISIAGQAFKKPIEVFENTIRSLALDSKVPSNYGMVNTIDKALKEVEDAINAISG